MQEVFVFHAAFGNSIRTLTTILVISFALSGSGFARDFELDMNLTGGYTDNLLSDSSDLVDQYGALNASVNYYPLSIVQLRAIGEVAHYRETSALGNYLYGTGITVIPISDSAGFSLFGTANLTQRDYREDSPDFPTNDFSSTNYDALISAGYVVSAAIRLRTGYSFTSAGYAHDEVADRRTHELLLGANLSLPGENALDVEGGYSFGNFEYLWKMEIVPAIDTPVMRGDVDADEAYSVLTEDNLNSFYVSGRLSRPVGQRTGVSLTASYRGFTNRNDEGLIYGYSTGYLSPWVASFEGPAVTVSVKSYIVPRLIVSAGFGYWDRKYLDVLEAETVDELDPMSGEPVTNTYVNAMIGARKRNDERRQFFLNLQYPLKPIHSILFEPSLRLDYISNSSSVVVYDYNAFSVSTAVHVRF